MARFSLPQVRDRHAGLSQKTDIVVYKTAALDVADGRVAAEAVLRSSACSRPTALAYANDLLALGALQHLLEHGVRVPQDVALVGFHPRCAMSSSALS